MSLGHIVECISKSASDRTDLEVAELIDWFLNMCPLNIKPDVARDILRNCAFRRCQRDDIIIRQGDLGDSFYIILDGKVSVYINTEAVPDDSEDEVAGKEDESKTGTAGQEKADSEQATRPVSKSAATKRKASRAQELAVAAATETKELDRSKYGNFIASFGPGKSFGELALINKDCVRNASIITDEATLLIEVNRDLYNRSLRVVQEAELRERVEFVNRCNVFDSWPSKYRRQAAMSLRKETFGFDSPIVRQGEPLNGLQFIISGQAKIVVNIPMHASQYPQLGLQDFAFNPEESPSSARFTADSYHDDRTQPAALRRHHPTTQRHSQHSQQQRHLELSLVGPGELIGDLEHGLELPTYAQSVICTQPSIVFVLDAKNYDRLTQNNRRNPSNRSQDVLVERAKTKLANKAGRSLDWRVPLIRCLYNRVASIEQAEASRKESAAEAAAAPSYAIRSGSVSHFIPGRGPLIDPYGPGTVFYRNRLKRQQRAAKQQQTLLAKKPIRTVAAAAAVVNENSEVNNEDDHREDSSSSPRDEPTSSAYNRDNRGGAVGRRRGQFDDQDTSSERLSNLESRIDSWLRSVDATGTGSASARPVTMMSRFRNEDDHKIFPGRRVCLRPRRPPITRLTTAFSGLLKNHADDGDGQEAGDGEDADAEVFITAQQADEEAGGSFASVGHRVHTQSMTGPDSGRADRRKQQANRQSQTRQQQQLLHPGAVQRAESASPPARTTISQLATSKPEARRSPQQSQLPIVECQSATVLQHHRSSQLWRSAAASAAESALTPAERRENTAAVLKEILNNQTLPDDVKSALLDLQKMSTVLPDLDSQPLGTGRFRARSMTAVSGTVGLGGVCYRCRRHHLASSLN